MDFASGAGVAGVVAGGAVVTGAGTAASMADSTAALSIVTAASLVSRAAPLKDCRHTQFRKPQQRED
jgi:hypothetical protein